MTYFTPILYSGELNKHLLSQSSTSPTVKEKGEMNLLTTNKKVVKKHLLKIILMLVWFLFVLYPNPYHLATSFYRLKNPPVMPLQVTELALDLEGSSTLEIEQFVYAQLPYSYDWEIYNMPWYFPSLDQAMQNGSGDCKARFLLFASLLDQLNIPYQKNISLTHIWADYEGKPLNALENREETMFVTDENGSLSISLPNPDLKRASRSFYRGFWEVMPTGRKYILFSGFPVIYGLFYLPRAAPGLGSNLFKANILNKRQNRSHISLPYK